MTKLDIQGLKHVIIEWSDAVAGSLSDWIQLDSKDDDIRINSELVTRLWMIRETCVLQENIGFQTRSCICMSSWSLYGDHPTFGAWYKLYQHGSCYQSSRHWHVSYTGKIH